MIKLDYNEFYDHNYIYKIVIMHSNLGLKLNSGEYSI